MSLIFRYNIILAAVIGSTLVALFAPDAWLPHMFHRQALAASIPAPAPVAMPAPAPIAKPQPSPGAPVRDEVTDAKMGNPNDAIDPSGSDDTGGISFGPSPVNGKFAGMSTKHPPGCTCGQLRHGAADLKP